jgi:hypothetical protein
MDWASGVVHNADIVAVDCIPASTDITGTVLKGQLAIKGNITRILLQHKRSFPNQLSCSYTVTWDDGHDCSDRSRQSIRSNFTVMEHDAHVDFDLIESGLIKPDSTMEIHSLLLASNQSPLCCFSSDTGEYNDVPMLITQSLLLRQLEGENFERIGFLTSKYWTDVELSHHIGSERWL